MFYGILFLLGYCIHRRQYWIVAGGFLLIVGLEAVNIQCPYCWEVIEITVDCSVSSQEYVEDCEVCCRPIVMNIELSEEGIPSVDVKRES